MADTPKEPTAAAGNEQELLARLARAEARYRALVEQIPAIFYEDLPDQDFEVSYVSPQIEEILGITPDEWVTDPDIWENRLHPVDRDRARADYRRAVSEGGPYSQEYRMLHPDGHTVWIRDQFVLVPGRDGNPTVVQGVMFDVTQEMQARHQLERVDVIGREFTEQVLQGVALQQILEALAGLVNNPVVLEDAAHQMVEFATHGEPVDALLATWEAHSRAGHEQATTAEVHHEPGEPGCIWIPVLLRSRAWGRIHVLATERAPDEIDALALDRAAAAVALTLHSEQHVAHLSDHGRGALMSDIWEGRFTSAQEVLHRARRLGAELDGLALVAVVVEPKVPTPDASSRGRGGDLAETDRQQIRAVIVREAREALSAFEVTGLSAVVGDRVLAIVGAQGEVADRVRGMADDLLWRLTDRMPQLPVSIGLSAPTGPEGLRQALTQADEAAAYGLRDATRSTVSDFGELGIHHLLMRLADGPELSSFVESQLKPLLDHDAKSSSPLTPTLRVFLANGGRKSETARALHLERRSLYYRLQRIEKVLGGVDLDDQEIRVRLEVSLRGLDLLRQRSQGRTGLSG